MLNEGLLHFFFRFEYAKKPVLHEDEMKNTGNPGNFGIVDRSLIRSFCSVLSASSFAETLHASRTPHFIRAFLVLSPIDQMKILFVFNSNHDGDVWHPRSRQFRPQNDNSPLVNIIIRPISKFRDAADSII